MINIVKIRIVKGSTEEGNHIMATRAPASGFDVAIALQSDFARFAHTEKIGLVVEGAEMMRAVKPSFVAVLMTL